MSEKIILIEDQLKSLPKNERKEYLIERIKYYKSCPKGWIDYIHECVRIPVIGKGNQPFILYKTQQKLVEKLISFLYDKNKEIFVCLGSRQCGKTTTILAVCSGLQTLYSDYPIVLLHIDDKRGAKTCGDYRTLCENRPRFMQPPKIKNALTHQIWKNGSSFMLQPTQKSSKKGSSDTGRSLRVATMWIDEGAFIDLDKLEESIIPTTSAAFPMCAAADIPFGIIHTSTPNGREGIGKKFYDYWKLAESGTSKVVDGYKLYWKDIPLYADDPTWYEKQREKFNFNERKINQEYELMFYGAESSFFTDSQIAALYNKQKSLENVYDEIPFMLSSGLMYSLKIFKNINKYDKLIWGIDVSKSLGQDYNVLEIFNYNTGEQVAEFANNKISSTDFGLLIDKIIKFLYTKYMATSVLIIEHNIGFALISQLKNQIHPELYNNIIYRDTIAKDSFDNLPNKKPVQYIDCKYGVDTTKKSRTLMINEIYDKCTRNIDLISSQDLLSEILSLQQDKDGKVVGVPHDDLIISASLVWMILKYGRNNIIRNLFISADEILRQWIITNNIPISNKIKNQTNLTPNINYDSLINFGNNEPIQTTPDFSEITSYKSYEEFKTLNPKYMTREHKMTEEIEEFDSETYEGGLFDEYKSFEEII